MQLDEIKTTVNDFLIEDFEISPELLNENARLKEDIGLDSLDWVDIIVLIEKHFGFKPDTSSLKNCRSLGDVYQYIAATVK